jgi:hypothetical protein
LMALGSGLFECDFRGASLARKPRQIATFR